MPDNTIRGRFAPSPSGRLHLGNMLTFLLAWLDVRARGGTMVFRLEDLDPERSWEHYADLMADDLLWLGLDWDEGWRPGSQDCRQGARATALHRRAGCIDRSAAWCMTAIAAAQSVWPRAHRTPASRARPAAPVGRCQSRKMQKRLRMGRRAAKKLAKSRTRTSAFVDATLRLCRQPNCGTGATIFSSGARTAYSPTSSP